MKTLHASVQGFNQNLRWEKFSGAAAFLPAGERLKFIKKYTDIKDELAIQNIEIQSIQALSDSGEEEVEVLLLAEYYVLPSTVVQQETVIQRWKFTNGYWQLTDPGFQLFPAQNRVSP